MVHWNDCFSNANLSLCGCGFLCIYHAGVCAALREYAPQLTRNKIYGASAGSIAAAGLICNVSVADATSSILQVVAEARSGVLQAFSPTFDLMGIVRNDLNRVLPENAHQLCSGRLFISLTRYDDGKNVIFSEFTTKKELIQAILCSCFIPIFCGYSVPELRGVKYIDGGFSDNQPVFDKNTITISPFSGESDICPMDHASASILGFVYYNTSIRFNNENFYRFCSCFVPPSQEICSKICRQGFTDALRFLTKNSITPCHRCLSSQSTESLPLADLRQNQSYFNISPPTETANNASGRKRKRLDSQCEVCLSQLEQRLSTEMTTALFPEILHKTLQEPVNSSTLSSQLLNYAHSFRIVQYGLSWVSPFVRYIDFALFILRMLNDWLRKTPKRDFFLNRLQQFVDILLSEVEDRNLICSSPNLSAQFRLSRPQRDSESTYLIGEFDSFDCLLEHSTLHELMILDFYAEKKKAKAHQLVGQTNSKLPSFIGDVKTSEPEKENNQTKNGASSSGKVGRLESDSGISSSSPVVLSSVSSDDGVKVKKRDVALSPVRALLTSIPRPKFGNRRHTVGVNTLGSTSANGSRRCSTQSLNKSVHSVHSLDGSNSKHSLTGGSGSQGSQQSSSLIKRQKLAALHSSSSSISGDEPDDEQFFVPNRMISKSGSQQCRLSDVEYDGDADPSA